MILHRWPENYIRRDSTAAMLDGELAIETGQPVKFTFTVTNTGDNPVSLQFRDACKADFVVSEDSEEHWRWSQGRMFAQVLQETSLAPGEEETFEATWDDPETGTYTGRAELEAANQTCEAETTFSVE
jgi:hypothetical protein